MIYWENIKSNEDIKLSGCCDLNRYDPHRHMCLNAWLLWSGTIRWCSLVGVDVFLLEELCHCGSGLWDFIYAEATTSMSVHFLFVCRSRSTVLSYLSSSMSPCVLPCFSLWWLWEFCSLLLGAGWRRNEGDRVTMCFLWRRLETSMERSGLMCMFTGIYA